MSQKSSLLSQSLSKKVLAAVSTVFLLLFIGQYSLARYIISRSYSSLEQEQILTNAERLQQTVNKEVEEIEGLTKDWGWWIDSYEYAQSRDVAYEEARACHQLSQMTQAAI
ncbi:MAG: hypothetical protein AAGN15_06770 [Cyanobacteria bacterium J06581_3]